MFHAFDKAGPNRANLRQQWMALLARSPLPLLVQAIQPHQAQRRNEWLRKPETGLYMVQGRTGGTGERFNLGEITVTRCAVRSVRHESTDPTQGVVAPVGVAYVLGRNHRQAELAAVADALLQDATLYEVLEQSLLMPIRQHLALAQAHQQAQVQSTRVDFFTVARETGGTGNEEDVA
jgi:alpha-D-ribose 1-methylphosphonate 5-triphosphate synthase subunit PhnG